MATTAAFQASILSLDFPSKVSPRWLDLVDCEQVPGLGTYLLVNQLINQKNPSSKAIQTAARLLDSQSNISFSIYPPKSSNPKSFIASMVDQALIMDQVNESARNLKEAWYLFQSQWSRIDFLDFAQCWSVFTGYFLKNEIKWALEEIAKSLQETL